MRVALLMGGRSSEREISLRTGRGIAQSLRNLGHEVLAVDAANGRLLPAGEEEKGALPAAAIENLPASATGAIAHADAVNRADVVFLALHGGAGEDGTIQALLEVLGVPYTGSGRLGSAMAMDKDISKRLFRLAGVPTADWLMSPVTSADVGARLRWPAVVKPSKQGSTVGLSVVKKEGDFEAAMALARRYDDEVMVERFVPGRELTVGVLEGKALPVGEIIPRHEIFDYECKYTPGMSEEIFPADLPVAVADDCARLALLAHHALKLGGYSRVDFRLTPQGEILCLEVNTLPGMTATSLLPQAARAVGIDFPELCDRICRIARTGRPT